MTFLFISLGLPLSCLPPVRRSSSGRCAAARGRRSSRAAGGVDVDGVEQPVRIGEGVGVVGDVLLACVGQSTAISVGIPHGGLASPVSTEGGVLQKDSS